MSVSVVRTIAAIEALSWRAERVTLAASTMRLANQVAVLAAQGVEAVGGLLVADPLDDDLAGRLDGRRAEVGWPRVAAERGGVGGEITGWGKMRGAGGELAHGCDVRLPREHKHLLNERRVNRIRFYRQLSAVTERETRADIAQR